MDKSVSVALLQHPLAMFVRNVFKEGIGILGYWYKTVCSQIHCNPSSLVFVNVARLPYNTL